MQGLNARLTKGPENGRAGNRVGDPLPLQYRNSLPDYKIFNQKTLCKL